MDTNSSNYLEKTEEFNSLDKIRQAELLGVVLSEGISLRMTAYGTSMFPFIQNGDIITIAPLAGKTPQIGDVLAIKSPESKQLVIHRVIRKTPAGYELKGDHNIASDGEVFPEFVIGKIVKIERKNRNAAFGISKAGIWIAYLSRRQVLRTLQMVFHLLYRYCPGMKREPPPINLITNTKLDALDDTKN